MEHREVVERLTALEQRMQALEARTAQDHRTELDLLRLQVRLLEGKYREQALAAMHERTAEQMRRLDALLAYFEGKRRE